MLIIIFYEFLIIFIASQPLHNSIHIHIPGPGGGGKLVDIGQVSQQNFIQ